MDKAELEVTEDQGLAAMEKFLSPMQITILENVLSFY